MYGVLIVVGNNYNLIVIGVAWQPAAGTSICMGTYNQDYYGSYKLETY